MKGAISYSLFGFDRERAHNCFDFNSYLRGMHLCLRFNRLIYPGWQMVVNIDRATYDSPYRPIFEWHASKGYIRFEIQENNTPLCKAMLWRLKTVFSYAHPEWEFSHVICRDLDSISTYREAQMVHQWVKEDKALCAITDSVSHTIPLMGGLVGFRPGYVNDIMKITTNPPDAWNNLINMAPDINYNIKGSDQDFMNRVMYPKLCTNASEFFIKGRPHDLVEGNGRHYSVPDITISSKVNPKFTETNSLCGHAGSAGFYEAPTMKFLYYEDPYKDQYAELENMKGFESIFYWNTREDLR